MLSVILAAYIAGRLYHDRTDSFCNDAFLVMVQARDLGERFLKLPIAARFGG